MNKPSVTADNNKRGAVVTNNKMEELILKENSLRKSAYKNSSIKTGESFFDDSDMKSDYYLIIVYHKTQKIPLLSARYFFDKSVIANCSKGDSNSENQQNNLKNPLNLNQFKENEVFLIDRLSGNINSSIYRKYRNYIHL